jgi:hypothetical protein
MAVRTSGRLRTSERAIRGAASVTLLLACGAACGGLSKDTESARDGGGSPATGGAGGSAATVNGGAGNPTECPFEPENGVQTGTFVLRNERAEAVYVAQQECTEFFSVGTAAVPAARFPAPYSRHRCSVWEMESGCPASWHACPQSVAAVLSPGAEITLTWPGTLFSTTTVSVDCYPEGLTDREPCRTDCSKEVAARAGRHRLNLQAGSEFNSCDQGIACPCQAYADGTCRASGAKPPTRELDREVEFEYPSSVPVFVVFQ